MSAGSSSVFFPEEEICLVEIEMVRAYDQGFYCQSATRGPEPCVCLELDYWRTINFNMGAVHKKHKSPD